MRRRRNPRHLKPKHQDRVPLHLPVSAVGLSCLGRKLAVGLQTMQEPVINISVKLVTWAKSGLKLTLPAFLHSLLIEVGIGLLSPKGMVAGGLMIKGGGGQIKEKASGLTFGRFE